MAAKTDGTGTPTAVAAGIEALAIVGAMAAIGATDCSATIPGAATFCSQQDLPAPDIGQCPCIFWQQAAISRKLRACAPSLGPEPQSGAATSRQSQMARCLNIISRIP
ncbi:MAG: hypothetical protein ACRD1E_08115 [Terriglobales bacterium]